VAPKIKDRGLAEAIPRDMGARLQSCTTAALQAIQATRSIRDEKPNLRQTGDSALCVYFLSSAQDN
jgi:hypothetical protein